MKEMQGRSKLDISGAAGIEPPVRFRRWARKKRGRVQSAPSARLWLLRAQMSSGTAPYQPRTHGSPIGCGLLDDAVENAHLNRERARHLPYFEAKVQAKYTFGLGSRSPRFERRTEMAVKTTQEPASNGKESI